MHETTKPAIDHPDRALIEQADDGQLLLGRSSEKLVEHYSFFAVFQPPEEFPILHGSQELGTLPIDNILPFSCQPMDRSLGGCKSALDDTEADDLHIC